MGAINVKVHYLYHSGFVVETTHRLLIFDYYQGTVPLGDKPVYVFSSHSHPDHYNPVILSWPTERTNIQYVFSSDIQVKQPQRNITIMSPYEEILVDDIRIKTFGSTDLGVSFLVSCEGIDIFHAGDLNWWYWWEDSPAGIAEAEAAFKSEIAKIKGEHIDLAFFPVDPRLEHNYGLGAEYFIKEIKPRFLIPMHFGDDCQVAVTFTDSMHNCSTKVIALTRREQSICL